MIIAVAGKGGTGKTTFAAFLVRLLKDKSEGSILAIDADPNSNLGELLGVKNTSTIVGIIDDISKNPDQIPQGITKDRFINLKVQESLNEEKGFDLLTMGRPEGPGCYCFVNNLLRDLITKLMNSYSYIVIDNEAGMEHLSRRLVRNIETFFILSDASAIGVRSAARISRLTDELEIKTKEKFLILNKLKSTGAFLQPEIEKSALILKATLPFDSELEEASIKGKSVFELNDTNRVYEAIKELFNIPVAKKE